MLRSPRGRVGYWNEWVLYNEEEMERMRLRIEMPAGDPEYRPRYVYELAKEHWHQILRRYSKGDDISILESYFPGLLQAWELSNVLSKQFIAHTEIEKRRGWALNLDHYIVCFWLVGLALVLEIPDDQWQRLLVLIGNEGQDALLDRVIASRQPGRKIGETLCHPKPYQRLLKAIDAPTDQQAGLLAEFVDHWYRELDRPAKKGNAPATAMYERPYWYTYGNQNFEGGAYFGRWCVEAVAAVKAFGLDDSLCLGHEHYPGDLLRPEGPSTHPVREDETAEAQTPIEPTSKSSWWSRWLGKRQ